MELRKKTSLLLSPELHRTLSRLAVARHVSMSELIRSACERQYGGSEVEARMEAVRALATLSLPVSDPGRMKLEAVPDPGAVRAEAQLPALPDLAHSEDHASLTAGSARAVLPARATTETSPAGPHPPMSVPHSVRKRFGWSPQIE